MLKDAIGNARIHKVKHYFEAYDFHFASLKDWPINILEIGIASGGSLRMWKNYFINGIVYGLDCNSDCRIYKANRINIIIGHQEDTDFLEKMTNIHFDIIVDDGGHTMKQQIASFNALFPALNDGGIYVIEDLCTSFWPSWGGGLGEETGLGFLKSKVNTINMWAARHEEAGLSVTDDLPSIFEKMISSIHFYNAIAFIYKKGHAFCPEQGKDVFNRRDFE